MTTDALSKPAAEAVIRRGEIEDAPACARILQDWLDQTDWMPNLHTLDETVNFMRSKLFPSSTVFVAEQGGAICGYLAVQEDGIIPSLAIDTDRRGKGIGTLLLTEVKRLSQGKLSLWTFVANDAAQRFYTRHGFIETRRTDGDNDEGLPDILMVWEGSA